MLSYAEIQSPSEDRETALLRAWRAACRDEPHGPYSPGPHECEPEDQGWNLDIAAGVAEGELIGLFPPKIAEELALAIARAALSCFWPPDAGELPNRLRIGEPIPTR